VGFPERAASAISSMLAPSNPRSRKTFRAAPRMGSSTAPAIAFGGRPKRTATRRVDPGDWTDWPVQPKEKPRTTGKKARRGLLKRRPVVLAIGAMLFAAAVGGGYVYLYYAERFQSTDDAFIAARQSALAPKVTGRSRSGSR
jgi:membrane fusion protein (multidrug efflux system)